MRFELTTSTLARLRSTPELRPRLQSFNTNGAGDEIRTHDINLGKVALYP